MANLNKVMLIGSLTRDPELKFTPSGKAIAQLGMAINNNYTTAAGEKREEVTFVDIEMWGKLAELAGEYLKKGRPVFIEGRLKLETWDDKATGQKRSKMKVVADSMQFLGSKEGGERPERDPNRQRAPVQTQRKPPVDADLDPEECPF